MTFLPPLASVLLVIGTPALVVAVVRHVARCGSAPHRTAADYENGVAATGAWHRLVVATAATWVAVGAWLAVHPDALAEGPPRAVLGLVQLGAFAALSIAFGLPALRQVAEAALGVVRARQAAERSPIREASLHPRRVSDYVCLPLVLVPYGLVLLSAVVLMARLAAPFTGERRIVLPVAFAAVSAVFALLYGVWIRQEACGPYPSGSEGERRASVRRVYKGQVGLVFAFSSLALALVEVDWTTANARTLGAGLALLGGLIGVVGCAFALGSDLSRRNLEVEARELLR